MATYTSHLNLKLPDYSDTADINDLNNNFKKIDDAIASGGTGGGTGGGIVTETDPTVPSWAKQPSKPTYTAAEVGALPDTTVIPTVPSALPNPQPIVINGISYDGSERKEITVSAGDGGSITETDPTVPAWAKAENKPSYTAEEVGALPSTYKPPVTSVNGKTGAVSLVASDVGALPNTTVIPTVPNALKNPYPLTINGVSYDGSEAKTVTIESTGGGASVELDTTLTQYGKAADAGAVGNAIAQETAAREAAVNSLNQANVKQDERLTKLEQTTPSGTSGLTVAQINALNGMFKVAAYIKSDVSTEYSAFKTAFGIEDSGGEPGTPEVTLTSISAEYSGGDVTVGTSLTDLTGITVTATYSDGSTSTVTDYTLSGVIAEGSNTITVSYGGKTTSFVVTGIAEGTGKDIVTVDATFPITLTWNPINLNLTSALGVNGTIYNVEVDVETISSPNAFIKIIAKGTGSVETTLVDLHPNGGSGTVTATATLDLYTAGSTFIKASCNKGTETSNQTAVITGIRFMEA